MSSGMKELRSEAARLLEPHTHQLQVYVGKEGRLRVRSFVNLLGATTKSEVACEFANLLYRFWAELAGEIGHIDIVVCPKGGSPILAYELAKLMVVPLLLHKEDDVTRISFRRTESMSERFDGYLPPAGSTALLVDDSSTGGTMMLEAAKALRHDGFAARHCMIVFEPIGKNARSLLESNGLELHSLVEVAVL